MVEIASITREEADKFLSRTNLSKDRCVSLKGLYIDNEHCPGVYKIQEPNSDVSKVSYGGKNDYIGKWIPDTIENREILSHEVEVVEIWECSKELFYITKVKSPVNPPPISIMAFPLKRSFWKVSPQELFENLRLRSDSLITLKEGKEVSTLVSKKEVYEKINVITDLFTEYARIKAHVRNQPSPLEYWEKNKEKIVEEAQKRFGEVSPFSLRETIYFSTKEATTFSPAISKKIYDTLLQEPGDVLDPFSGWGDRAIGALASKKVLSYTGVDANSDLKEGYERIKDELPGSEKIHFNIVRFEDFKTEQRFNLIFSSPPYFDFEIYSDSKDQSIFNKRNYDTWFYSFMRPSLKKMVDLLKKGGIIALHIGATNRTPNLHDHVYDDLTRTLKMSFIKQIDCSVEEKRPVPIWVYQKK